MRTRTAGLVSTLIIAGGATACSGGNAKPSPTVTVTKTVAAPTSPKGATASNGVLSMGAKKVINDGANDVHLVIQAAEYEQPYKGPQPQKPEDFQGGDVWATIYVKVCNLSGPDISVSQTPWSLEYADGTSIEVTGSTGGDMPKPEFPMDRAVEAGRCAAGLIAYPVPSDKKPERVVYAPDGLDPVEWAADK